MGNQTRKGGSTDIVRRKGVDVTRRHGTNKWARRAPAGQHNARNKETRMGRNRTTISCAESADIAREYEGRSPQADVRGDH